MNSSVNRSNKYDKRCAPSSSVPSGSEWSEHISSSGKRYYYNCVSEVSQWEKPREWDSRRTSSKDSTYSSRSSKYLCSIFLFVFKLCKCPNLVSLTKNSTFNLLCFLSTKCFIIIVDLHFNSLMFYNNGMLWNY